MKKLTTIKLEIVPAKNTKDCFSDFIYRDSDFDAWLPKKQPELESCNVTVFELEKPMTFKQMVAEIGDITKHTLTMPAVEVFIGEHSDQLQVDGWGNFFFIETGDPNDPVAVGNVHRRTDGWYALVYRLGNGDVWNPAYRLLVRNVDTTTLERSVPELEKLEARVTALEAWKNASLADY